MLKFDESSYIAGKSPMPLEGVQTPQERKSPPLATYLPEKEKYIALKTENYYRPEFVALEWDKLWTKIWLCAGRVSDLETKGDWFRFDFGRESFIVSRSGEDEIVAMYNVCQHRANRLVDDDFGHTTAFICPYHSWRFDRAGKCTRVTDREMFGKAALEGSLDLPRVRCETWGGFVFINMDENAKPLAEHLGEVMDIASAYHPEGLEVRADVVLQLDCNWKTILDAFSENYHVHITHPFSAPITEDKYGQMDFYAGGHTRRIVMIGDPSCRRGDHPAINPEQAAMLESVGVSPTSYTGSAYDVRRAIQEAKRAMNGAYGEAFRDMSDSQLTDDWAMNLFPNMHLSMHAEGVLCMRYYPHRTDPGKCYLHVMTLGQPGVPFLFYLPDSTDLHANGRPKRVHVKHDDPDVIEKAGQLLYEDIRNTRETQLGLQSRGFRHMRLSEHEQPIMFQASQIAKYLNA